MRCDPFISRLFVGFLSENFDFEREGKTTIHEYQNLSIYSNVLPFILLTVSFCTHLDSKYPSIWAISYHLSFTLFEWKTIVDENELFQNNNNKKEMAKDISTHWNWISTEKWSLLLKSFAWFLFSQEKVVTRKFSSAHRCQSVRTGFSCQ